jgi:formylglycine-generating enzyme required for sulfatase activity
VEITNRSLDRYKLSLRQTDNARQALDRMLSGSQPCTPANLFTVGRGLWNLVTDTTSKGGRQDALTAFWHVLLYELRRRLPRANTCEQWVELDRLLQYLSTVPITTNDKRYTAWKAFLDRWVSPPFPNLPPEAEAALEPYQKNIVGKFHEISLSGFGGPGAQSEAEGKAELAKVYVDLDAKTDPGTGTHGRMEAAELGQAPPDRVPALERIALQPRLVLIGLPGSGKSTLLKFFSLCLAQCGLKPEAHWLAHLHLWPKEEADLIPVFVELRQFAAGFLGKTPDVYDGQYLTDYILAQLKPSPLEKCAGPLTEALTAGRVIVFLDGLDEVPDDDTLRRFVLDTVEAFAIGPFKASRIVVSCRPRSYDDPKWQLDGFERAELAELDKAKIEQFIERFYEEVAHRNQDFEAKKADRVVKLKQAVQREELRELAANPFMLTVMAWLHRFEELPKKRAAILNRLVEMLLFKWEEIRLRDDKGHPEPRLSELLKQHDLEVTSLRRVLCRLAFQARLTSLLMSNGAKAPSCVSIPKSKLLSALEELPDPEKHSKNTREQWALQVCQVIDLRTGLLVPDGGDSFTMPYKLQEFLAGEHLTNRDELQTVGQEFGLISPPYSFDRVVAKLVGDNGYWEEVVKWAAAIQAHVKSAPADARDLALELCTAEAPSPAVAVRRAVVAGEILWEVGPQEIKNTHRLYGPNCLKRVRDSLDEMMTRKSLPPKQRASAGVARGWLEDLPRGVGLKDGLPDIDFIPTKPLPSGKFMLAENRQRVEIEQPYRISRYPVTVAQFQAFVAAGGYEDDRSDEATKHLLRWWGKEGLEWKRAKDITEPEDSDPVFQTPNHPRVGMSWYEAMAFCAWLTDRLWQKGELKKNQAIRLPHEAEWEQAARWNKQKDRADDRLYPWSGKDEQDLAQRCNMAETVIGHTSAVGLFPNGNADCGAADMSGNVWEWCENWYDEKEKQSRVLRGGSWGNVSPERLRCAYRNDCPPDGRNSNVGFRCVLVEDSSP